MGWCSSRKADSCDEPSPSHLLLSLSQHQTHDLWNLKVCLLHCGFNFVPNSKKIAFLLLRWFLFPNEPKQLDPPPPPPFSASLMFGSADHRPVVTVAGIGLVCALLVVVKGPFVFGKLRQTSLINVSKSNLPNFTHAICLKAFSQPTTHKDVSQENLKDWTGGRLCSKWGRRIRLQPFACLIGQTF